MQVHIYTVTWLVDVDPALPPNLHTCTSTPGSGFFNTATLTVGAIPIDATACIPVADFVSPTITKTVTSNNQDPSTGEWTTTYDIVVALAAGGTAQNPSGLDAEYGLVDTLSFGGDIDLISAGWSGHGTGTFALPTTTATLAPPGTPSTPGRPSRTR